jgi:pseudaminic acid cytidylyltransferase
MRQTHSDTHLADHKLIWRGDNLPWYDSRNMKLALIPARGGSKRIPDKNIVDFFGLPMIVHSLNAAQESKLFSAIHVSTDSEKIRTVVEKAGFAFPFFRPSELSDDFTPLMPVIQWALQAMEKNEGVEFQDIALIMPTAPLVRAKHLIEAFELYEKHNREFAVCAVTAFPVPTEWAFLLEKDGRLTPSEPGKALIRSQDLQKKYYDCGAFYIYPRHLVLSKNPNKQITYVGYPMPKHSVVDIDEPEDLELAKILYAGRSSLEKSKAH